MSYYFDTSAVVKLVITEPETPALHAWVVQLPADAATALVTCDLTRTELLRAVRRHDAAVTAVARQVLDAFTLLTVPTAMFEAAARLDPPELRSLDAIHLAAALDLGDDLDGLVTYDKQLSDAASEYGLRVLAPR